jgi:hypothetical protein
MMSSDSAANAATQEGYVADTGVITLGPNQVLRMTAVVAERSPVRSLTVTFNTNVNTHGTCNSGGACVHTVASRTATEPITLTPGQGASIDIVQTPSSSGVRGEVLMLMDMRPDTRPEIEVNALIVDATTGAVVTSNKLFVGGLSW